MHLIVMEISLLIVKNHGIGFLNFYGNSVYTDEYFPLRLIQLNTHISIGSDYKQIILT